MSNFRLGRWQEREYINIIKMVKMQAFHDT